MKCELKRGKKSLMKTLFTFHSKRREWEREKEGGREGVKERERKGEMIKFEKGWVRKINNFFS